MEFYFEPFRIISAARIPGIQPRTVKINTIIIDPQPLSTTAKGGQIIANKTRKQPIVKYFENINLNNITMGRYNSLCVTYLLKKINNYSQSPSSVSSISPGVLIIFIKVPIVNSGQCKAILYLP